MALWSSLSSMLKRDGPLAPATRPGDAVPGSVQQARVRARQRLIGALLLLTVGVIGFPLLFESRPRPIPVDIPIEIPARDGVPALVIPDAVGVRGGPTAAAAPRKAAPDVITETPADAGREVAPPETATAVAAARSPAAAPANDRPQAPQRPDRVAAEKGSSATPLSNADAGRAQALLDGRPLAGAQPSASALANAAPAGSAAKPGEPRYIIQVGAFADPAAARETRLKVERLGMKTYTQVAETPAGPRTRVRVGPFAARGEADKAMARVKAAGVAAAILTL